ncbi:hypothetical protein [Burkholderia cepacia]|uniref:hypothetical protein n=1 Tax=Burkholderia cepacia TaxID=292 RepID=UPI0012D98066|nr:hypothetical protein [Burkholderia cepacia]
MATIIERRRENRNGQLPLTEQGSHVIAPSAARRVSVGAARFFARSVPGGGAVRKVTEWTPSNPSSISNAISKKICVLEIDLEITTSFPDKAHKQKRVFISKSPNIFASGGTIRIRTTPLRRIEPTPMHLLVFLLVSMEHLHPQNTRTLEI